MYTGPDEKPPAYSNLGYESHLGVQNPPTEAQTPPTEAQIPATEVQSPPTETQNSTNTESPITATASPVTDPVTTEDVAEVVASVTEPEAVTIGELESVYDSIADSVTDIKAPTFTQDTSNA